jgi:hypothetical protein
LCRVPRAPADLANGSTACRRERGKGDLESDGEAAARGGAVGRVAGLAGEQPRRRLPHAHLQLPQPYPRFDSLP